MPLHLWFRFCQMLADFHNSFTDRLSSKFKTIQNLNFPHFECVTMLLCEKFALKTSHVPELTKVNCHKKTPLAERERVRKKYSYIYVSINLFTAQKTQWPHWRTQRIANCIHVHNQDKTHRDKTRVQMINVLSVTDNICHSLPSSQQFDICWSRSPC